MPVKIGINGYGRIGRMVLRALYEGNRRNELSVVAVNDLGDAKTNAHLTRYDSAHGPFPFKVEVAGNDLVVDGDRAVINWLLDYTAGDGKRYRIDELAVQEWRGGKIVSERFVYDSATIAERN